MLDRHRDDIEVFAGAWAIDAQAGVWLICRAMGEADDVAPITGEEFVLGAVERDGNVAAAVDICVKSPLEVDYKAVDRLATACQLKLARCPMGKIADLGHHESPMSVLLT